MLIAFSEEKSYYVFATRQVLGILVCVMAYNIIFSWHVSEIAPGFFYPEVFSQSTVAVLFLTEIIAMLMGSEISPTSQPPDPPNLY